MIRERRRILAARAVVQPRDRLAACLFPGGHCRAALACPGCRREFPVNIVYLTPSPKPPVPGTDGLCTEIGYFYRAFGGTYLDLSAFRSAPPIFPVRLSRDAPRSGPEKNLPERGTGSRFFPLPGRFSHGLQKPARPRPVHHHFGCRCGPPARAPPLLHPCGKF